jgi:hypothetical protein
MDQTEPWVTGVHDRGKNQWLILTVIEVVVLEGREMVS